MVVRKEAGLYDVIETNGCPARGCHVNRDMPHHLLKDMAVLRRISMSGITQLYPHFWFVYMPELFQVENDASITMRAFKATYVVRHYDKNGRQWFCISLRGGSRYFNRFDIDDVMYQKCDNLMLKQHMRDHNIIMREFDHDLTNSVHRTLQCILHGWSVNSLKAFRYCVCM